MILSIEPGLRFTENGATHELARASVADAAPPFWELEALIGAGYDSDAALAIMAARRRENFRCPSRIPHFQAFVRGDAEAAKLSA
jgi:hypothetical protein